MFLREVLNFLYIVYVAYNILCLINRGCAASLCKNKCFNVEGMPIAYFYIVNTHVLKQTVNISNCRDNYLSTTQTHTICRQTNWSYAHQNYMYSSSCYVYHLFFFIFFWMNVMCIPFIQLLFSNFKIAGSLCMFLSRHFFIQQSLLERSLLKSLVPF